MTIHWPRHLLKAQHFAIDIAPRTLAGPASISGNTQVTASDAGIWKATLGNVLIRNRTDVLLFRAIGALLEGRLNPIYIPLCRAYQPIPLGVTDASYAPIPHSDTAMFSDGSGYVNSTVDIRFIDDAPLRATTANVEINVAGDLSPGQHFSVQGRLYRLRTIAYTSNDTATITFRPTLREPVFAGDRLEFDNPVCRMRLASDKEMDLNLELLRFATPTVNLFEDL